MQWKLRRKFNLFVPAIILSACGTVLAQAPTYDLGRTPSAEEVRSWDIAISPEGKELPPGSGTAKQGAEIYRQKCAVCHGADLEGAPGGRPLRGGRRLAYATTLWDEINRNMPWKPDDSEDRNQTSLSADEVYALTAFLLCRFNLIREDDVLDARSLPKIPMPNRNGFVFPNPVWKPGMNKPFGIYPWPE